MNDQNPNTISENPPVDEILQQEEFGLRLREAREAAGLTIPDVSEALKLKEDIIRALENSQVEKLPVSAFTQGYIRSYSRLLKLPAEELIEIYTRMVPQKEIPLVQTTDVSIQSSSGDGGVKMVTGILVSIGLFLLVMWWLQTDSDLSFVGTDEPKPDETAVVQQQDELHRIEFEINVDSEADPETRPEVSMSTEPPAADAAEPEITIEPAEAPKPEPAVAAEKPAVSTVTTVAPKRQVLPGKDTLLLRSGADSWTEIEDENGQRHLFQLVRAGDFYQLQGRAPFRIFLGNAPSVEITINDKAVDLSNYIRQNNIAHVAVKADGSVQLVRGAVRQQAETDAADTE